MLALRDRFPLLRLGVVSAIAGPSWNACATTCRPGALP